MTKTRGFLFTAALALATAFTLSCSGGDEGSDNSSSSGAEPGSSSSVVLPPGSSSSDIPPSSSSTGGGSSSSAGGGSSSSSLPSSSSQAIVPQYGEPITDERDGKTYETVVIGTQTWMAKNLNFETEGSKCYNDNALNCTLNNYGRQYNWEAAMSACPAGWHLPDYIEWVVLEDFIGGTVSSAWKKLRAANFSSGTDDYGFSAIAPTTSLGYWSSEESGANAYYHSFSGTRNSASKSGVNHSVRCVKGESSPIFTPTSSSSYTPVPCASAEGFCDGRDGKSYKSVDIDGKTWMAENLNFDAEGSVCYENDPENCNKYGRLYNWVAAMGFVQFCNKTYNYCSSYATEKHKGICPDGWHLPSDAEWTALVNFAGGSTAGTILKAESGWNNNGADLLGFSALPGGVGISNEVFILAEHGYWWSSTEASASDARDRTIYNFSTEMSRGSSGKSTYKSIRCIKD